MQQLSSADIKVGQNHVLVDRTVHEESRVRGVPADATGQLCGPIQHCRHVGTILGRPP